jgi:hypothetical protein
MSASYCPLHARLWSTRKNGWIDFPLEKIAGIQSLYRPHSIGFSGGQLPSYVEGSSALDFPLMRDAQPQEQP